MNDSHAYRTNCGDERTKRNAPNGAYGEHEVEISQGLGLASLNINFCQQTWHQFSCQQCAWTFWLLFKISFFKQPIKKIWINSKVLCPMSPLILVPRPHRPREAKRAMGTRMGLPLPKISFKEILFQRLISQKPSEISSKVMENIATSCLKGLQIVGRHSSLIH